MFACERQYPAPVFIQDPYDIIRRAKGQVLEEIFDYGTAETFLKHDGPLLPMNNAQMQFGSDLPNLQIPRIENFLNC